MRLLRLNGSNVDIDDNTAIGITIQTYDFKEPGKRKIKVSNNFNIPVTSNNLEIIGFANNVQSTDKTVYGKLTCNYWVDNKQLIENAFARVTEIGDRINIFVFEKPDVWELMKTFLWEDFTDEFLTWLQDEKGYPTAASPFLGNFNDFILDYIGTTEGLLLPMYMGNLYNYNPGSGYLEDETNIWLKYYPDTADEPANGGHFCAYAISIFEFIEYKYSVNFLTSGGLVTKNIWDDAIAPLIYTPLRNIDVRYHYTGIVNDGFYFELLASGQFQPEKDIDDKGDKSLYDFVNSFLQHFNILIDDLFINDEKVMALRRFDDMENDAPVINFGNITGKAKFKPSIDKFVQTNYIKFKEIYEGGNSLLNSRTITCKNENLDATGTLFEIDAYVPDFINITGGVVPNLSPKESFKTFQFLISEGTTTDQITISISEDTPASQTVSINLLKAAIYDLSGEYLFIDNIVEYPIYYDIEKWLTLSDVFEFEFWKLYWIKELNGSFFINKISGFNPQKSNKPTKMELIRISDRTPQLFDDFEYWTDGFAEEFSDGLGNFYY